MKSFLMRISAMLMVVMATVVITGCQTTEPAREEIAGAQAADHTEAVIDKNVHGEEF